MNVNEKKLKRLLCGFFVSGIVFGSVVGGTITYATMQTKQTKQTKQTMQTSHTTDTSDTKDTRDFTHEEMSADWGAGELEGFEPLHVNMNTEHQEFLYGLCVGYDLDFDIMMKIIETESGYNPKAVSSSGDYGYMQLNEMNHEWIEEELGITDFTNPYENIRGGVWMIKNLKDKYEDWNKVLMCYNMGETNAKELWEQGIYETSYTKKILGEEK